MPNTQYRSEAPEIMDNFKLEGEELLEALDKIAKINHLLGGNKLTLQGVNLLLQNISKKTCIEIIDIGCGNGDMLRALSDFSKKHNMNFRLVGIDANSFTIKYAEELSKEYADITYRCEDVFDKDFEEVSYDIALCTLTLHHFKDDEIVSLVKILSQQARVGVVINDLHRSIISYRLFQLICLIFSLNEMSKKDGLVSILRGFKKNELERYSRRLDLKNYTIKWKWAFRFQWIISNI